MIQHGERCFSLLTSLYSLLAFGRSGLFGPPLCGGSAPATPPLLHPRVVASMWAIRNCPPVSACATPRLMADSENVPARARQARLRPYMPNVHRDDHREPATEMLTVHFPQGRPYTEHGLVVTFLRRSVSDAYLISGVFVPAIILRPPVASPPMSRSRRPKGGNRSWRAGS